MKTTRKTRPSSSSTSTVTYTFHSDTSKQPPTTTTVHLHDHSTTTTTTSTATAAAKIQAAYRAHMIRTLVKKVASVKAEADRLEELIQQQETVDAVRSSEKEKVRMNEALMGQLLELDSVPGFDPGVRELRRSVSRRIVGLQEIMDGICGERVGMEGCDGFWRDWNWDEMVEKMEEDVCRERGGEEFERFCAQNLGFRCLQRFLREA